MGGLSLPFGTNSQSSYHSTLAPPNSSLSLPHHPFPSFVLFNPSLLSPFPPQSTLACAPLNPSLASSNTTFSTALLISGNAPSVLNTSAINVPLPGPSSINTTPSFRHPWPSHSVRTQSASISPNIWLISGEVMKSPVVPKGSGVGAPGVGEGRGVV